ncbi:hypothetical protein PG993_006231 [Apiospora rasikravindrae]|uniref:Uncharacterized protein n=1 Tax=Apiospora rasikravindrae TaxID=990691 RepID=A0ABR1T544_9PEZI
MGYGSRRLRPYIALRILCRVKWNSKQPGLQAVTDEYVLVQVNGGGGGCSAGRVAPKEDVRDMIAKALEAPKSDVILEYSPRGTSFLGARPELWVSRARKMMEERAAKQ